MPVDGYTLGPMGQILKYRCGACHSDFSWMSGQGMLAKIAHCGTCGTSYAWPLHDGPGKKKVAKTQKCTCGGAVSLTAKVRCPGCKGTDVSATTDSTQWE
jgi:cytochrome c1